MWEIDEQSGMLLQNRVMVLGVWFMASANPSLEPGHEAGIVVGSGEKNAKNGKSYPIGCVDSMT